LLTLAAFNLSFLFCRDHSSIPAVYVGANSARINIVLTAIYYAGGIVWSPIFLLACPTTYDSQQFFISALVNPGLHLKRANTIDFGFLTVVCCFAANVLAAYSVYFDSSNIATMRTIFQAGAMCTTTGLLFRWVQIIARKQNVLLIRFDRLTTDEFATFSYVLPPIISAIAHLTYAVTSGELSWQSRSPTGLLVSMAIIYFFHSALIRKVISYPNPTPDRQRL
jgi:hypothetical protein